MEDSRSKITCYYQFSSVWLFVTPSLTAAHQATLSISNFWSLLKLMSIKSVLPFNHLILCPVSVLILRPYSLFPYTSSSQRSSLFVSGLRSRFFSVILCLVGFRWWMEDWKRAKEVRGRSILQSSHQEECPKSTRSHENQRLSLWRSQIL